MNTATAVNGIRSVAIACLVAFVVGSASISCALARSMGDAGPAADAAIPDEKAGGGSALASLKPGRAVLVDGAAAVKGIPGFGLNALPAVSGLYAYSPKAPSSGPSAHPAGKPFMIPVWFTRIALVLPASWAAPAGAATIKGFSVMAAPAAADGSSLWALLASGYAILIELPPGLADAPRFVGAFAERFAFFYRYAERPEDVSFPAILAIAD
jgi:hypothetical protein